jgi:mitochondrial distribution and morphology protein 12
MFMSLPMKLCVTGYTFEGEVIVAYEGSRRRVHLCIVDDQDASTPLRRPASESTDTEKMAPHLSSINKPVPIGQRLFPNITIESEIGDADKHILKNVSRVERFIQDIIRKTIEDELVFPNFHTVVLAERS